MDCRQTLLVGVVLGCLATGCVATDPRKELVAQRKAAAPAVAAESTPDKKRLPLPSTCVAWAVCKEREAAKLDHEPALQRELRDEARKAYQEALRLDPKFMPAHAHLARLYVQMEDYDRAEETFQKALDKFPKEVSLWFDLGMCHCRRKNWQKATQAFQKALEIDPENPNVQRTLGFTLARAGMIEESLNLLTQAQGRAQAHYNVARMLLHLERPDEARQHLERALHVNPNLQGATTLMNQLAAARDGRNLVSVDINFESPAAQP